MNYRAMIGRFVTGLGKAKQAEGDPAYYLLRCK